MYLKMYLCIYLAPKPLQALNPGLNMVSNERMYYLGTGTHCFWSWWGVGLTLLRVPSDS